MIIKEIEVYIQIKVVAKLLGLRLMVYTRFKQICRCTILILRKKVFSIYFIIFRAAYSCWHYPYSCTMMRTYIDLEFVDK